MPKSLSNLLISAVTCKVVLWKKFLYVTTTPEMHGDPQNPCLSPIHIDVFEI